jgi:uncharacterized surface protein with fasciclin (FAS1) repeats
MNKTLVTVLVVIVVVGLGLYAYSLHSSTDTSTGAPESGVTKSDQGGVVQTSSSTTTTTTTSNGVLVGGALMTPDRDIVANALNASNVTTLVAAVKAAGLVATLQGPGPFTVFAPTNAAFEKLPSGTVATLLLPANKAKLVDILTYHVVPGRYTAADLKDGMTLTTVEGKKLTIGKSATGQITVNGTVMVETPDVISSNGVTFVVSSVLIPPSK